jgi:hypothetical protein
MGSRGHCQRGASPRAPPSHRARRQAIPGVSAHSLTQSIGVACVAGHVGALGFVGWLAIGVLHLRPPLLCLCLSGLWVPDVSRREAGWDPVMGQAGLAGRAGVAGRPSSGVGFHFGFSFIIFIVLNAIL